MVHDISLGEIKIETVETSLFINGEDIEDRKYDYKCGFMEYFGIMDLITIDSTITKYNIEKYYIHSNVIVLIIENMSLGIVMNAHLANKFKYIQNAIQYKDHSVIFENGMKIVKIPAKWETSRWSYFKLRDFYNWIRMLENKTIDDLPEGSFKESVDKEFLDSLCWNVDIIS